jgi:hypothetical protein
MQQETLLRAGRRSISAFRLYRTRPSSAISSNQGAGGDFTHAIAAGDRLAAIRTAVRAVRL